jgi:hypothetical protein
MSKGQRGNKEAKKPKRAAPPALPAGAPPVLPTPSPDRPRGGRRP